MIGRRGFLQLVGAAVVGVVLACEAPKARHNLRRDVIRDPESGIAIRFISQYDSITDRMPNRFDVLGGMPMTHIGVVVE